MELSGSPRQELEIYFILTSRLAERMSSVGTDIFTGRLAERRGSVETKTE